MNRAILHQYLAQYKEEFDRISQEEIYKWRAVQHFQNNWDIKAVDFAAMLKESLSKTRNLLVSGNYFPRRMIEEAADASPETVRQAFADLYDEDADLQERVQTFRVTIQKVIAHDHPNKKTYQDDRAIIVYLVLRYPDDYFLYKFRMFKAFCEKVEADYKPKMGAFTNVLHFNFICRQLREEIIQDNELLKKHKERLGDDEYFDQSFNILTQDVVYAITRHLDFDALAEVGPTKTLLTFVPIVPVAKPRSVNLMPKKVNYESRQRQQKKIGDLGEQLVLQHERANCKPKFWDKIRHVSVEEGDGLGYDILSFDEDGREKYIEVKTTTGGVDRPFFVTANELERSRRDEDKFVLYRLYNFNEKENKADFFTIQGSLEGYCINPIQFQVEIG